MVRSAFAVVYRLGRDDAPVPSAVVHRAAAALVVLNGSAPEVHRPSTDGRTGPIVLGTHADGPIVRPSAVVAPGRVLAAVVDPRGVVRADPVGLAHCCWAQSGDHVVVSDSALVVAAAVEAELDPSAVAVLSLVGFLLGGTTLYRGVRRLRAGESLDVRSGRVRLRPVDPDDDVARAGPGDRRGWAVLGSVVADLLEEHPDPVLELSGGLDSRGILAAIPPDRRRGLRAVTLGHATDPDVCVARRLARRSGLDWDAVDPGGLVSRPPHDLMAATVAATRRRDLVGNALSAVALAHAEAHIPSGPRFTGANGEFARGFYYPGFLTDGPVDRSRIERLVAWRLFANDGPAARALDPELVADARAAVVRTVTELLPTDRSWRAATDEFYLTTRMANWAGPGYSTRDSSSPALAPFLHPDFLAWARDLPLRRGARERTFARMVRDLAPGLADEPLERGSTVTALAAGGAAGLVRDVVATAGKAVRKVDQRVRGRGRAPALNDDLATAVQAGWRYEQSAAVEASGLFQPSFLSRLQNGDAIDGPSLSLAVNVATARTFPGQVATVDVGVPTPGA